MIYDRIKTRLDQNQNEEQFGFRSGRSTADALLFLEQMISNTFEWNSPLWMVSIDMRKAFDRIEHTSLFRALKKTGVDEHYKLY